MKANIAKAHATTIDMGTQQKRTKSLADQGVFSAQQNDDAQANYDEAVAAENATVAQEKQAEAQLAATIAQRDQAKAQVLMQKAAVDSAKLQLSYCTIRAPIDGTVINRTVNCRPAGSGQPAGAQLVQHRAGSDTHAGLHQHRRGRRRPHPESGRRRPFAWTLSAGNVLTDASIAGSA